jgi:dTDP-glucose 4,6-dehydratase
LSSSSVHRILVTGGAGFIGSHIVDQLVIDGFEVGVLDNLSTGSMENIQELVSQNKVKLHNSDISDAEAVSKVLKDGEYEAVLHEAALVSVTRSIEDPLLVNRVNVDGSLNLLKAAVDAKVQKFVYASSSSVYGDTETLPKKEDMITSPISPYGVSKLTAENYCRTFARVYGLETISLRYFNVYGPRQKAGPYSGVIPTFIKKVLANEQPVVFGDGQQTRDFTYVQDVVQANMLALKKDGVPAGEVYNIAKGATTSINELAQEIIKLLNKPKLKISHGPARLGDIKASYADIGKAVHDLGYKPEFSIQDGLKKVIELVQQSQETATQSDKS